MREQSQEYAPYVENGQTVEQYCKDHVDPAAAEMDNLSLKAAFDVVIAPAGIALEVIYLDLSPGTKATTHRFEPMLLNGAPSDANVQTIRLLYRP